MFAGCREFLSKMAPSSVKDEDRSVNGGEGIMSIPGAEDTIDPSTFEQILEMDEDEAEREFSKSIVYDFFTQAEGTFTKMDTNLCVS